MHNPGFVLIKLMMCNTKIQLVCSEKVLEKQRKFLNCGSNFEKEPWAKEKNSNS